MISTTHIRAQVDWHRKNLNPRPTDFPRVPAAIKHLVFHDGHDREPDDGPQPIDDPDVPRPKARLPPEHD